MLLPLDPMKKKLSRAKKLQSILMDVLKKEGTLWH